MNRIRILILDATKSFFSLIALVLLTVVIHEGAHFVAAHIMKISIASFTWFDPRYLAPVFVSGSTEHYAHLLCNVVLNSWSEPLKLDTLG